MPRRKTPANARQTTVVVQQPAPRSQQPRKAKRKPKQPIARARVYTKMPRQLLELGCGLVNAFCDEARLAKYPDTSSAKTLNVQSHGRQAVVTASGSIAYVFLPSYVTSIGYDAAPAAGVAAFTTLAAAAGTASYSPSGYRLDSFGIKIRCLAAPNNATGMVRIRCFATANGSALGSVNLQDYTADFCYDIPLSACKELTVLGKRISSQSSQFTTPATTMSTSNITSFVSNGWGTIFVLVDGGPAASTPVDVEYVYNYELTFNDGDGLNSITSKPPVSNTYLQSAVDFASEKLGQVFAAGATALENAVINRIDDYVTQTQREQLWLTNGPGRV